MWFWPWVSNTHWNAWGCFIWREKVSFSAATHNSSWARWYFRENPRPRRRTVQTAVKGRNLRWPSRRRRVTLGGKTPDKVLKFQLGLWIKERTWRIYIHLYNNRLLSAGSMFFTLGWFCMFTVAVSTFQRALGRRVQVPLTTCCLKLKQTGSPFGAWYQRHVRSFVTIRQVDRKTHRFTAKFKTADHQNGRRGNFRWFYSTLFRGYKQKCAFFLVSRDNQGALFRNWGGTLTSWWLWQILSLVFK